MGARGRKPTPTHILKVRGSWRANINRDEPQPDPGEPDKPDWLCPVGSTIWAQMVPLLLGMRVLTKADGPALGRYCEYFADWLACRLHVLDNGLTYETEKGPRETPEATRMLRLEQAMSRLEQCFGLTPSARSRITVPGAKPAEEKDRFFRA